MRPEAKQTIGEIHTEAVHLAAMIEGLAVLVDAADGNREDPEAKRAANCLGPMSQDLVERAQKISTELEAYL